MKKALNVFGIIFAVIFSLALIPTLIMTPVWKGVSGLLEPEFLQNVVTEVVAELDEEDFTFDTSDITSDMENDGIDPELTQAIAASAALREIAPLLGNDMSQVVLGEFTTTSLTAAEMQRIGTANKEELAEILTLAAKSEGETLSADEASLAIEQLIADAATLESELNSMFLELQTDLHTEYAEVLALLTGPVVTTALLITALILAALIFLCRWPHQEGLLWLGIDSALAALPVLGIAISFKGAQFSQALAAGTGLPNVFAPVLRQAGNATLAGGALLLAAAVLLIGGYVLLRDRRMKREAAYADRAPAAQPTAQAAPFSVNETRERSPWDNV